MKKKIEEKNKRKKERKTNSHIACVASVSAGVRRECWDESKKDVRNKAGGDGGKRKPLVFVVKREMNRSCKWLLKDSSSMTDLT